VGGFLDVPVQRSGIVDARSGAPGPPHSLDGIDLDVPIDRGCRRRCSPIISTPPLRLRRQRSALDLDAGKSGHPDVVPFLGVLHHSRREWQAFFPGLCAGSRKRIAPVALYRRTPFCGLWRREKRFYANAPAPAQKTIRALYKTPIWRGFSPGPTRL